MKKLLMLALSLIPIIGLQAMEKDEDPFNAKNKYGWTPLYCTTILLPSHRNDLAAVDLSKARMAAMLILKHDSKVDEPDIAGKTPLNCAEAMKNKLPKVYEVMRAGKVKQDFEKTIPQQQNYTVEELMQIKNSKTQAEAEAWGKAMAILFQYCEEGKSK